MSFENSITFVPTEEELSKRFKSILEKNEKSNS